jgi:hypothetical protein
MKNQLRNILTFIFLFFAVIFNVSADQQQDPALIQDMLAKYSLITPQILAKRHYWLELALANNLGFNEPGLMAEIGYRMNYFGFDLRLAKGKSSYGDMRNLATSNVNTDPSENTEIDLPRNNTDLWGHWSVGPGFSVANQFFSGVLSRFTERVRAGIAIGNYNDDVNHIPFKSYIFNVETSVVYQLRPNAPWSLCGSLNWNSGMLVRDYSDTQLKSYGLPISWIGSSLGLEYAF